MKVGYDKMVKEKGFGRLSAEEMRKRLIAYNMEQYHLEAADEEAYKELRKYGKVEKKEEEP